MAGLYSRVKTWVTKEILTAAALNAEFDNVINNFIPSQMDDYSETTTEMKIQTSPGSLGAESQATSLAGEIERLRYMMDLIIGKTVWYDTPSINLASVSTTVKLPKNRIVSGRIKATSSQPIHLVPNGAAATVTIKGATTNFLFRVQDTEYTISTDVDATLLTQAPAANNTCLVNDGNLSNQPFRQYIGTNGRPIHVDTMGSEIVSLVGSYAAFKMTNAGAEDTFFKAYVESSTELTEVSIGHYHDSTDALLGTIEVDDDDTITLMQLSWVFAKTDLTLDVTYNIPVYSASTPAAPSVGDYWFDTANDLWNRYNGSAYIDATAQLVGECLQDATNTVAARSFFPTATSYSKTNSMRIRYASVSTLITARGFQELSVYGTDLSFEDSLTIDLATDFAAGETEAASRYYFIYITEAGAPKISIHYPHYYDGELRGWYHPGETWRYIGAFYNEASSNVHQESAVSVGDDSGNARAPIVTFQPDKATTQNLYLHAGYGEIIQIHSFTQSFTSISEVVATNSIFSIISNGRPVQILLQPTMYRDEGTGVSGASSMQLTHSTDGSALSNLILYRDIKADYSTEVAISDIFYSHIGGGVSSSSKFTPSITWLDLEVEAGVRYYYRLKGKVGNAATDTFTISALSIRAYEI